MSTAAINKLNLWGNLINERKESGLTIREWLIANNRSRREYYYWNRKIKDLKYGYAVRKRKLRKWDSSKVYSVRVSG